MSTPIYNPDETKRLLKRNKTQCEIDCYLDKEDVLRDQLAAQLAACDSALTETADALRLILPMAKGYAHAHPVGNNQKFIEQAEAALTKEEKT